ncbi:toxin-antitoxin system YwqK family antitoxin [Fibrobacterota bacterium]
MHKIPGMLNLILPVLIPLALSVSGCKKTVRRAENYESGPLKREWFLIKNQNGVFVKTGALKTWYEDGQLESVINYRNGQKHGIAKAWFPNRQVKFKSEYKNNFPMYETQWDEAGKKVLHRKYRIVTSYYKKSNDHPEKSIKEKYSVNPDFKDHIVRHGAYLCWHRNGNVKMSGEYLDGKLHGFIKEWHPNGRLYSEGHYLEGKKEGPWSYWHDNGKLKLNILFRKGKKDGPYHWWYANGLKKERCEYLQDTLDGIYQSWYENGQPHEQRKYRKGMQVERSISYYPNGQESQEVSWKDNQAHGTSREWYESGELKSVYSYAYGLKTGPSEEYYQNGKKFIQAHYKIGKLDGKYRWWTDDGNLISLEEYEHGKRIYSSRVVKIKEVLDALNADIPMQFMGFCWSISPAEAAANIRRLHGAVTKELDRSLVCRLPFLEADKEVSIKASMTFNRWDELYEMHFDFPNQTGKKFSHFSEFIEKELEFKLGIPKISRRLRNMPGILQKKREWGTFVVENLESPQKKQYLPVISAEVYSFENKDWITFTFQNHLMREYAVESGITLSGPYYEEVK